MGLGEVCEASVNIENITEKDEIYEVMVGVDKKFPLPLVRYFKLNEKYLIGNKLEKLVPYKKIIVKSKRPLSLNENNEILQVLLEDKTLIYDATKSESEKEEEERKYWANRVRSTNKEFKIVLK